FSCHPSVKPCNLLLGIPFENETFDVVYHSHMLEHLERKEAMVFLQECLRVLRPEGVLRVVVPDLEQIVIEYLNALKRCVGDEPGAEFDHQWMLLEMYDQTVRSTPGGEMRQVLSSSNLPNMGFIVARLGQQALEIVYPNSRGQAAVTSR